MWHKPFYIIQKTSHKSLFLYIYLQLNSAKYDEKTCFLTTELGSLQKSIQFNTLLTLILYSQTITLWTAEALQFKTLLLRFYIISLTMGLCPMLAEQFNAHFALKSLTTGMQTTVKTAWVSNSVLYLWLLAPCWPQNKNFRLMHFRNGGEFWSSFHFFFKVCWFSSL